LAVESSAVGGGVGVDCEAEHVDGDMVVVPTKGDEIRRVMITAVVKFCDVVDLEAVS
jgi:hypothetical protein